MQAVVRLMTGQAERTIQENSPIRTDHVGAIQERQSRQAEFGRGRSKGNGRIPKEFGYGTLARGTNHNSSKDKDKRKEETP
jgi:hypothetical protein